MKKILIIGATSAIAQHTVRRFAARGDALCLVARNPDKLAAVALDAITRGAKQAEKLVMDLTDTSRHAGLWEQANRALGGVDTVLIAHGILPDQKACEADFATTLKNYEVNFLSVVSLLTLIANQFERQKSGCIAVISSVAGERGRQSNYMYGSAKGALTMFLQGLRNRLYPAGVSVITIIPGFVDTPMTAHLKRSPLFASPAAVARGIDRAIQKKKDVVYLPGYWRTILWIIRCIPETIFKRLKL